MDFRFEMVNNEDFLPSGDLAQILAYKNYKADFLLKGHRMKVA